MQFKPARRDPRLLLLLTLALLSAPVLAADEPKQEAAETDLWKQVQALYEQAKEAGEQVPGDIKTWVSEDVGRIGGWEYEILDVASEPEILQKELNRLGSERWECIWIQSRGKTVRLTLKRPTRSYLSKIPMGTLLRLIPLGGGE